MLAATAATLGIAFAIGKMAAAFAIGVFGGFGTALVLRRSRLIHALRDTALAKRLSASRCTNDQAFDPRIWRSETRRRVFTAQTKATTRLILICLIPAFAAVYALNAVQMPNALASYLGEDQWWSIPVAVFVGTPAYLDG